jgi:dienelactone hydrolase
LSNWLEAGRAVLSWLRSQPEVDPDRVALQGTSMGSFCGTQVGSVDDRLKGCSVRFVCHEPGLNTLFNMSSPTFKLRFMYRSGFEDEGEFDKFAQTLSLEGIGEKIKCPYLVVAGEDDHLSPIGYTYDLLETVPAPKQSLLYEGADHGLNGSTSSILGPNAATFLAEWIKDRVDSKPTHTKHMKVDASGRVHESTFEEARKAVSVSLLLQSGAPSIQCPRRLNRDRPKLIYLSKNFAPGASPCGPEAVQFPWREKSREPRVYAVKRLMAWLPAPGLNGWNRRHRAPSRVVASAVTRAMYNAVLS